MTPFLLTLKLAATVAGLLLVLGTPIAYWLAFSKVRWRFLVEAVVALPLVLPPTVLGFYCLVALGARSPLGAVFERIFGHSFAFSFAGLVAASLIYSLPFAVQPLAVGFSSLDRRLLQAAATLGAGRWRTLRELILPLSIHSLVTAAVLSFAHTVGEFGVVLMVGGNIPGVTRTLSIEIYDRTQSLDYAGAQRTSMALLLFSFAVLSCVYGFNRHARVFSFGDQEKE